MKKPWGDTVLYGAFGISDFLAAGWLMDERWAVMVASAFGGIMIAFIFLRWVRYFVRRSTTLTNGEA